jgi:hypothetical protein
MGSLEFAKCRLDVFWKIDRTDPLREAHFRIICCLQTCSRIRLSGTAIIDTTSVALSLLCLEVGHSEVEDELTNVVQRKRGSRTVVKKFDMKEHDDAWIGERTCCR